MTKSSFINPNTLSLPESSSPTPEPGPSRKRPRTEMTSEERKEARAHRNRIAAQNSRDRRKAQFSHLERRVAELEEENRQLRAGLGISSPTATRDRENEELRERIKTLEQGWDAVVKALAAQGLPTLPAPKPAEKKPEPAPATPPSVFFPLSPAPSNSSLEFESNVFSPDFISPDLVDQESTATRHLAAGGLELFSTSYPSETTTFDQSSVVDDSAMEDLFREIFVTPSSPTSPSLPLVGDDLSSTTASSASPSEMSSDEILDGIVAQSQIDGEKVDLNWATKDIQRLLDLLPIVAPVEDSWDPPTATVGVF